LSSVATLARLALKECRAAFAPRLLLSGVSGFGDDEQRTGQRFRVGASAPVAITSSPSCCTRRSFSCFALSASAFSSESKSRGLRIEVLH
jgi:hypothetical protein